MEKKTTTTTITPINDETEPLGVCQKLLIAILRISHRPREPSPATTHHSQGVERTIEIQNGASTMKNGVVLVPDKRKPKDDHDLEISSQRKLVVIEEPSNGNNKKNPDVKTDQHPHDHLNNTFEEYIQRVGTQIRKNPDVDHGDREKKMLTSSGSGTDHVIKKKGSFKDHISDYIHRTKYKIGSHSSVSAGSSSTTTTTTSSGKSV